MPQQKEITWGLSVVCLLPKVKYSVLESYKLVGIKKVKSSLIIFFPIWNFDL